MTSNDYRLINIRYSCPLLRREDLLEGKVPTAPTISSIIAGLQTQEALKVLHGLPVAAGKAMIFNGVANTFYTTAYPYKEDCLSHESYGDPIPLPLGNKATAAELFDAVEESGEFGGLEMLISLELDRDLVASLDCESCGTSRPIFRPRVAVGMKEAECPKCHATCRPKMIHQVRRFGEYADRTLADLGIPPFDVVKISVEESYGPRFFLLSGDAGTVWK
jgi:adenylyltransferase/sulfurtransferase